VSRLRFEPRPFCAWVQHANHSATEPPQIEVSLCQKAAGFVPLRPIAVWCVYTIVHCKNICITHNNRITMRCIAITLPHHLVKSKKNVLFNFYNKSSRIFADATGHVFRAWTFPLCFFFIARSLHWLLLAFYSRVSPAVPLSDNNLGQVVRTHVPLSPSSKFGTGQRAVMRCNWEGNRRSGVTLAIHLQTHGLRKRDEHPAHTPHGVWHTTFLSSKILNIPPIPTCTRRD